jgi:hypothetical protein
MPFPGSTFKVTADEISLGPGITTVLETSLLFEAVNHQHTGFDFGATRLVRANDIDGFEVAYSLQGSIQKASFTIKPKYIRKNEGIEKDVTSNPLDWTSSFWKLHTITGAVTARILADRANVQAEGMTAMTPTEFDSEFRRALDSIARLPFQQKVEVESSALEELNNLEAQLAGIFLKLSDAWLVGSLSLEQRVKTAVLHYLDFSKRYELGWHDAVPTEFSSAMTNQDYKDNAENWLTEERSWGSDLREMIPAYHQL